MTYYLNKNKKCTSIEVHFFYITCATSTGISSLYEFFNIIGVINDVTKINIRINGWIEEEIIPASIPFWAQIKHTSALHIIPKPHLIES